METKSTSTYDRYNALDAAILFIIGIILVIVWYRYINHDSLPYEDAAMIFRYAEHLAQGHGFVWNIGDAPVDGATDVLFTLIIAAFVALSVPADIAAQIVIVLSHVCMVALVYHSMRHKTNAPYAIAGVTACFIAVGSFIRYYEAYFATSFFALCTAVVWYYAMRIAENDDRSSAAAWNFSFSGLILGLARPEGVFLAFFILFAVMYRSGVRETKKIATNFIAVYAVLGGLYFAFHWLYFGYPLPNPFYKKGGWFLHADGLRMSVQNVFRILLPLSIYFGSLVLLSFFSSAGRFIRRFSGMRFFIVPKESYYPIIPIAFFTFIWVLLSNEMNYIGRYQYAVVPIAVMSWYPSLKNFLQANDMQITMPHNFKSPANIIAASLIVMVLVSGMRLELLRGTVAVKDGRYDVAVKLNAYRSRGYTMAVSEAGLLPYYSGWRTLDAWGLNDIHIAQQGGLTHDYIDQFSPDIIMFYDPYNEEIIRKEEIPYLTMINSLYSYARSRQYIFAAAYGVSPYAVHYYFVKRENPDANALVDIIRSTQYLWWQDGRECFNFAMEKQRLNE